MMNEIEGRAVQRSPNGVAHLRPGSPEWLASSLADLAYNLRWAWHGPTQALFQALAPEVWTKTRNPVAVLRAIGGDTHVLRQHGSAIRSARQDLQRYLSQAPAIKDAPRVAYLCAEFGIAECLPIYSGGLGVLAGDHLKAASDLGLPLVGVGLLYRYGYFRQTIDASGYQREQYDHLDPDTVPLRPVQAPDGSPLEVSVPFPRRTVRARVWLAQVGRVPLYLLDTELPENREDDRWITGHLYGGDHDTRIRQEIVLGIGGIRLLRALAATGLEAAPDVFHMNEGHSAFIALELARELLVAGAARSVDEALQRLAPRLAFTTHTPVPAGHDAFASDLAEAYFDGYRQQLKLSHQQLMELGRRRPADPTEHFSMTVLALRSSAWRNGVSRLHGDVSRAMWGEVGVGLGNAAPARPMGAVTNGVHTATWVGPEMSALYDQHLGRRWRRAPDQRASWQPLEGVATAALWQARTAQRARLLQHVDALARAEGGLGLAAGLVAERTLVLGFARRFATYKRAALLLRDPERLARLLGDPARPVLLVFAGKAHPRDDPGKQVMQRVVQASREDRFRGRLVFLPNYDLRTAQLMVQGSDVWLNTPRRPMEASGTSGMKAVINGALHLSELDGWWSEAYRPGVGWALGAHLPDTLPPEERDQREAEELMHLLEETVHPLYFERPAGGPPLGWLALVRASLVALAPAFSAQRMVREYVEQVYAPAAALAARERASLAARSR